jgi:hypothetical protein
MAEEYEECVDYKGGSNTIKKNARKRTSVRRRRKSVRSKKKK